MGDDDDAILGEERWLMENFPEVWRRYFIYSSVRTRVDWHFMPHRHKRVEPEDRGLMLALGTVQAELVKALTFERMLFEERNEDFDLSADITRLNKFMP